MAGLEITVTLCILGCGNLGNAILDSLIKVTSSSGPKKDLSFDRVIACVRSESSEKRLNEQYSSVSSDHLVISRDNNVKAVELSQIVILAVDPSDIEQTLSQPGLHEALANKLLISVAAGWTRKNLETFLYGSETTLENNNGRAWVVRTLPNIAAQVSQSFTAIEVSEPAVPAPYMQAVDGIFKQIGQIAHIPPRLMDASSAVAGSTPAFFAIIVDALIDAAVAVGMPRPLAQSMIFQSMQGTASILQSGVHQAILRDQGTAPEGCTIAGLMVMEEGAVRGHVGRALREAVTVARQMDGTRHVNDTRQ
ncbi:pyrroline-5-carboxylate reductase dimerization-domain-containing protein [Aspergillus ambiguus]|uniref:pyrroline-5-carboxylate reductase family protein n=1 Tax=Aspergillus ambiguus TaxID=176160 RepID=UPI003CCDDB31